MSEQSGIEAIGNKRPKRKKIVDSQSETAVATDRPISTPTSVSSTRADGAQTRYERIATAAYRLAQQRGFTPGKELEDWLTAERAIDQQS